MSIRQIQQWASTRPWAVRVYAVAAVITLPVLVAFQSGKMVYEEIVTELPDFFREVWYAIRTGKFK